MPLQFLEVEVGQLVQFLLLLPSQFSAQDFAHLIRIRPPDFAKVFGDAVFLLRREIAEGAPQKHQRSLEFLLRQRANVAIELLPESKPRQQRVAIALGQSFKPTRAEIGGNAWR